MQKILPPFEDLNPHDKHLAYCAMDTMMTYELHDVLQQRLVPPHRETYYFERSLLSPVLVMMKRGFKIDMPKRDSSIEFCTLQIEKFTSCLNRLTQEVFEHEINSRSHVQLKKLFYEELLIPEQIRSVKGVAKISLDRDILEKLAKNYSRTRPFVRLIIKIRDYEKQKQTLEKSLAEGGRWIASYNVAGTDTGRWSSSDHPLRHSANIQNIDPKLREVFVVDEGRKMAYCDLQGAEARAVAYLSGDENYIKAVEETDVHTMVASLVFGLSGTREDAERIYYRNFSYRDLAKRCAHGTNYGGSARTLASSLKVETKVVDEFQRKYNRSFPGIKKWQEFIARQIQTKGYLDSPMGRRRFFNDRLYSDHTHRKAIAYGPQSIVADIIAEGLIKVYKELEPEVWVHAMIHDALVVSIEEAKFDSLLPRVIDLMTIEVEVNSRSMIIPVDAEVGYNWGKYKAPITSEDGTISNGNIKGLQKYA